MRVASALYPNRPMRDLEVRRSATGTPLIVGLFRTGDPCSRLPSGTATPRRSARHLVGERPALSRDHLGDHMWSPLRNMRRDCCSMVSLAGVQYHYLGMQMAR